MKTLDFMDALGDLPEEIVKCYFDENTAIAENPSSDLKKTNSSETLPLHAAVPASPERTIRFSRPAALIAAAACMTVAVGMGLLIYHLNQKPNLTQPNNAEQSSAPSESTPPLLTVSTTAVTTGSGATNDTTTNLTTKFSKKISDFTSTQTLQNVSSAVSVLFSSAQITQETTAETTTVLTSAEITTTPEYTTTSDTKSAVSIESTTTQTAAESVTTTTSLPIQKYTVHAGEPVLIEYIREDWKMIDCSNWEKDNPQFVSQPFYQALSDAEKMEIQQKITLLEFRSYLGYAMKLREQIMGRDTGNRLTLAELQDFLTAHSAADAAFETDLQALLHEKNRSPDVDFGSGMSYAYYFLDESGKYSLFSVNGSDFQFVYYTEETGQLASVPMCDALSVIHTL